MTAAALFILAVLPADPGFEAYAACANRAAIAYRGASDPLDVLIDKVEGDCASERKALLEAAPDREQASGWIRTTTALAVSEEVAALQTAVTEPASPPPVAVSRYPKLEAYRLCGVEQAAQTAADRPYMAAEAIAAEATARCEKPLKEAAEETAAEMRQPGLRTQVMIDFRRRSIADLTQKIGALRAEKTGAGK